MSRKLPKKWEQTARELMKRYKSTGKRVELITEDGAFVLQEGKNNSGDYIEIVDEDEGLIEIVVEG